MKKSLKVLSTVISLLLAVSIPALGQATSGDLVGTVKDASGAVVPNASVTVTNEATGVSIKMTANGAGQFRAANLPPGAYDVQSASSGFALTTVKGVIVDLNKTSTADVSLGVGASTTSVEVEAIGGTVLDTTSENLSTSFSNETLSDLPVTGIGSGVLNASLLAPGVGTSGGLGIGAGPSIAGQRERDNNFMVEGIDNNRKDITGPLIYVPNDAVGEFTLITTQFSPEFGHSAGGQFNTNIVSGTNHFHGKLYEYFQNRNLNAASGVAGNKVPNGRYDNNRYGGQLGGPIFRDKLFFFANYERNTIGQSLTNSQCVPTTAGRATLTADESVAGFSKNNIAQYLQYEPSPNSSADPAALCGLSTIEMTSGPVDANGNQTGTQQGPLVPLGVYNLNAPTYANQDFLTTGMDYTLSSKDTIRGRYLYNTAPAFDSSATLPAFYVQLPIKFHLVALSEFHNFTPNLINELRLGFNRFTQNFIVGPQTYPGLDSFPNIELFDTSGNQTTQIGPDPNAPQFTIQNLYQITDNVSYSKGKHTLKIGFDGRKYISPQGFTQRARGDYEYTWSSDFFHDFTPDSLGERSSGTHTYYGDQTALYGYANDTYRATEKLTLNVGLRYEFTTVPTGERSQNLNAIANAPGVITFNTPKPARTSLAPRVGVEFAPDTKTSIRAGFGVAYDVLFDNLGTLSFPPEFSVTQDVGTPGQPAIGSPNFLANGGLKPGTGSGTTTFATAAIARSKTSAYVPDQVVPYSENYSLTIQREIGYGLTAEIGYVGDIGIHLPTQDQLNIQPEVTSANYLPTFAGTADINGHGSNYSTLAAIKAAAQAGNPGASATGAYFVPAFYNAGFIGTITSYQPYSQSNYNGLIANLQGRMKNGLQMQLSYTFSKTMDDATAEVFATSLTGRRPQNPRCVACDYSLSALSRKHRLSLEADYNFKAFKGSSWFMQNIVSNWQFAPIYTYESPEYATVLNATNSLILPSSDGAYMGRPVYNPNGVLNTVSKVTAITSGTDTVGYQATTPNAMYIQAGSGTIGNTERNTLAGRPIDNIDFSASKQFTVREHYSLLIGAVALNVLNHAQYIDGGQIDDIKSSGDTNTLSYQTISSGTFANSPANFNNNPRTMALTAKIVF
jgi:Carboxypeptidase regulatory-like domain/TonB dependent receptor